MAQVAHATADSVKKGKVHFVVIYSLTGFEREKYDHFGLRTP